VEQNVPLALQVGDYAYIMSNGRITHHCISKELARDEALQAQYIGVAKRRVAH
jgi:ABC-type branched-subunit amino acid transport system ATPase component